MPDRMVSARVAPQLKEGVQQLAEKYNVSESELLRYQITKLIGREREELPDHVIVKAILEETKQQNKPMQQVAHLPNNLYEEMIHQIKSPYPMPPDEFREEKTEPYKECTRVKYDDETRMNENLVKLEHAQQTYEYLHPRTDADNEKIKAAAVHAACQIKEDEDMETARAFVNDLVDDGAIPDLVKHEVLDTVREKHREEWQQEWRENMSPHLKET